MKKDEKFKDLIKQLKDDEGLSDYGVTLLETCFKDEMKEAIQDLSNQSDSEIGKGFTMFVVSRHPDYDSLMNKKTNDVWPQIHKLAEEYAELMRDTPTPKKEEKKECEYIQTDKKLPYPRVEWKSECGFRLVILEGYNPNYKSGDYGKLVHPSGNCMKCKSKIKEQGETKPKMRTDSDVFPDPIQELKAKEEPAPKKRAGCSNR